MENLTNLQNQANELENEYRGVKDKINEQSTILSQKVVDFLQTKCNPTNLVINADFKITTPYEHGVGEYDIVGRVGFNEIDDKINFGSQFDLDIYENQIKVNKGTVGPYTQNDKYQVGRDRLLGGLWNNYEELISLVKENVDVELLLKLNDLRNKLYDLKNSISHLELEIKNNENLEKLKKAKYYAEHSTSKIYKNSDYWTGEVIGTKHNYYNIFVIEKVTDKSVIGYYEHYKWEKKRLSLTDVLCQLRGKCMQVFEERPESYEEYNQ